MKKEEVTLFAAVAYVDFQDLIVFAICWKFIQFSFFALFPLFTRLDKEPILRYLLVVSFTVCRARLHILIRCVYFSRFSVEYLSRTLNSTFQIGKCSFLFYTRLDLNSEQLSVVCCFYCKRFCFVFHSFQS